MTDAGRWLTRFQEVGDAGPEQLLSERLEYLDVRLRKLRDGAVLSTPECQALLARVSALWEATAPCDRRGVTIHADYCAGNVLIHEGSLTVLDFTMARQGGIYHDLAHMYTHLMMLRMHPLSRSATLETLGSALLEGFRPGLRSDDPLFQIFTIHHVLNQLTKLTTRRPNGMIRRMHRRVAQRHHRSWLRRRGCFDAATV
jgi:Ser/Thr protein kinase RdoA (MazF antagonist)